MLSIEEKIMATTATQTIDLVDSLQKAKIPRHTATKLMDYIDDKQGSSKELLKKINDLGREIKALDRKLDRNTANMDKRIEQVGLSIFWLRWTMGVGFASLLTTMLGGFALFYDIASSTKADMDKRFDKLERLIDKRR